MPQKQILDLNAFDMARAASAGPALAHALHRRATAFGPAALLFYDTPLEIVQGQGCILTDSAGTQYLDAYNNVPSVGHAHPHVVQSVAAQLATLNTHTRYLHPRTLDLAERLLATFPAPLGNIVFTCTGSESNDLALRLAHSVTGATGIIVTEAAYHGNTSSVTAISPASFKSPALPPYVRTIPAPDARAAPPGELGAWFAARVADAIAGLRAHGLAPSAFIADTIFSSDGVFAGPPGFLGAAVATAREAGALFIADEVQPGFGRTGAALWGFQRHGVTPDIVTLGKPMGNGYPAAAVITRPDILAGFNRTVGYFNTFGGSPVAAAAAAAVLDVIERENLMENAAQVGTFLRQEIAALAASRPAIADVRGAGLYLGIELRQVDASRVINAMRRRRVLIGAAGREGNVLKIRPPLCFTRAHAGQLLDALRDSLAEAAQA
jgi:4-aminobutyrate aminotransferase-like enzyme